MVVVGGSCAYTGVVGGEFGGVARGDNADDSDNDASTKSASWRGDTTTQREGRFKNDPRHQCVVFAARIDEFDALWLRDLEGLTPRMIRQHVATIVGLVEGAGDGFRVDRAEAKAAWKRGCSGVALAPMSQTV